MADYKDYLVKLKERAIKEGLYYNDLFEEVEESTIKNFEYNSKDESILKEKFLSRLAAFLVHEKIPPNIAYGIITNY